mmetsp:Transcript_38153/g.70410  ORF Transcript_38153/g.70410 Transcript_38153/m.70410 type:complete len:365 (+) Transcript_38153:1282-2376(+)
MRRADEERLVVLDAPLVQREGRVGADSVDDFVVNGHGVLRLDVPVGLVREPGVGVVGAARHVVGLIEERSVVVNDVEGAGHQVKLARVDHSDGVQQDVAHADLTVVVSVLVQLHDLGGRQLRQRRHHCPHVHVDLLIFGRRDRLLTPRHGDLHAGARVVDGRGPDDGARHVPVWIGSVRIVGARDPFGVQSVHGGVLDGGLRSRPVEVDVDVGVGLGGEPDFVPGAVAVAIVFEAAVSQPDDGLASELVGRDERMAPVVRRVAVVVVFVRCHVRDRHGEEVLAADAEKSGAAVGRAAVVVGQPGPAAVVGSEGDGPERAGVGPVPDADLDVVRVVKVDGRVVSARGGGGVVDRGVVVVEPLRGG